MLYLDVQVQGAFRSIQLVTGLVGACEFSLQLAHLLSFMDLAPTLIPLSLQLCNISVVEILNFIDRGQNLISFNRFWFKTFHQILVLNKQVVELGVVADTRVILRHLKHGHSARAGRADAHFVFVFLRLFLLSCLSTLLITLFFLQILLDLFD